MSTSRRTSTERADPKPVSSTRFFIGVTGARTLTNAPLLGSRIESVLARIGDELQRRSAVPGRYVILSPLAEGADRLVARKGIEVLDAQLVVVLPLDENDYVDDFETSESKAEFNELRARAHRVTQVEPATSRAAAYEMAGRYVVDHCDVLIALWDGEPASGRGGTAEIVSYARRLGCPLFWISTEDGGISEELGSGLSLRLEFRGER